MKIKELVHKIPDTIIIFTISIWVVILMVYGFATINALKAQIQAMQLQQNERTEAILKRAGEERQKDMETFFETHDVSCTCNQ